MQNLVTPWKGNETEIKITSESSNPFFNVRI